MALLFFQLPLSFYDLDTFLISCIVSITFISNTFNSYSVLKTRNHIVFAINPGIFVLHYRTNICATLQNKYCRSVTGRLAVKRTLSAQQNSLQIIDFNLFNNFVLTLVFVCHRLIRQNGNIW